jgi:type VI secretion system protein ImpJ
MTLRLSSQENAAYLTCPVARLVRNAQGLWSRDPSFIPPMLSVSASPPLTAEIRLQARRRRLMAMRRESNERMADFAVADVSLFWLLNALNSAEPPRQHVAVRLGQVRPQAWLRLNAEQFTDGR